MDIWYFTKNATRGVVRDIAVLSMHSSIAHAYRVFRKELCGKAFTTAADEWIEGGEGRVLAQLDCNVDFEESNEYYRELYSGFQPNNISLQPWQSLHSEQTCSMRWAPTAMQND